MCTGCSRAWSTRLPACGHRQARKEEHPEDEMKNTGLWAQGSPEQWRGKDCVYLLFAMLVFMVLCRTPL